MSGDELSAERDCCRNSSGQVVVRFAKQFIKQIEEMEQKSYVLKSARVRFVLYWAKENADNEIKIILPEVVFEVPVR